MLPQNPKARAGQPAALPSFDEPLDNEEEVLDQFVTALSRGQLPEDSWGKLHDAAKRDDRSSELAFAYEAVTQGKRIKTLLPAALGEFYFRAAQFFGDVFGDDVGATAYLERAIAAAPGHVGAFEALDHRLTNADANKKLAELCAQVASHRPKPEQAVLLRRAAVLYERTGGHDEKVIEMYQALLRAEPSNIGARDALEARYTRANRHRDVARLLENAITADPPPAPEDALKIRERLIELYSRELQEPERTIGHVEAVLAADSTNESALKMGERLLGVKALAARAAGALGAAVSAMGRPEDAVPYIDVELENVRGPKRKDPLKRLGLIRRDNLDDKPGAYESFEAVLGIDPSDDEARTAFYDLATELGKASDAARTLSRVLTMAKDAAARSKISAEMADLLRIAGDAKRSRTTHAGVIVLAGAAPEALLRSARALAELHKAEGDQSALASMLEKVGTLSEDPDERLKANTELAELASGALADAPKAIAAWRNLVDSSARARALVALEPLYTEAGSFADLAFVLTERAKDEPSADEARALTLRAAEMYATKTQDKEKAAALLSDLLLRLGPDREVIAKLAPLLEAQKQWSELSQALEADAKLADDKEAATSFARLGSVRASRLSDIPGAIDAYRNALDQDPTEKSSRAALERLLASPDHRLEVADVLEPVYRAELLRGDSQATNGLLRILDLRSQNSAIVSDRLEALGEAVSVAETVSHERALEYAGRALAEAVLSDEEIGTWLRRVESLAEKGIDPKKLAATLSKALGDKEIASAGELDVATRAAEAHATAGEVDKALALYRRALVFEPSSQELVARTDDLLSEQGNPKERVALYRTALEQGNIDAARMKQLLVSIGTIERVELGNKTAAVQAFKTVLKADPEDHASYVALSELYAELEQWEKLCDLYEDHLEHADADDAEKTRAKLAETAALHGQKDRAILHAFALLTDDNISDDAFGAVSRVADELKDMELQRAILERKVDRGDDPGERIAALERLGALLLERGGDQSKTVEYWKQAADTALGISDDPLARRLLERVRELRPDDVEAARELLAIVERAEDYRAALPLYDVLHSAAEGLRAQIEVLARIVVVREEKLGDPQGALEPAAAAFELVPADHHALATFERIAIAANAHGRFAAALDEALSSGALTDTALTADLRIAKARVLSLDPAFRESVIETYRRILETPGVDEGRVNASAHALEELLPAPKPGLEKSTRRWLAEWKVGHAAAEHKMAALLDWGDVEERVLLDPRRALEVYRRAIAMDAQNVDATAAIARLSIAGGDIEGAIVALVAQRELLEGAARTSVDLDLATILLEKGERPTSAMEYVAEVLDRAPSDARALSLAARMLGLRDTKTRAVAVLEGALDGAEDPAARAQILEKLVASQADVALETRFDWYQRLIDLHLESGQKKAAFEAVRAITRVMPDRTNLWDKAEQLARDLETPDPVAELYEHALTRRRRDKDQAARVRATRRRILRRVVRSVGPRRHHSEARSRDRSLRPLGVRSPEAGVRCAGAVGVTSSSSTTAPLPRPMDDATKVQLLEDVAQIAKDFANSADRSISLLRAASRAEARQRTFVGRARAPLRKATDGARELIALLTTSPRRCSIPIPRAGDAREDREDLAR